MHKTKVVPPQSHVQASCGAWRGRGAADPVDYKHPYPSMAQYAELLALRFDAKRTRHAYTVRCACCTGTSSAILPPRSTTTCPPWKRKTLSRSPSERPKSLRRRAVLASWRPARPPGAQNTRPNQREKPKTALTAARGFCKLRKSWSKVRFRSETKPRRRRSALGPEKFLSVSPKRR